MEKTENKDDRTAVEPVTEHVALRGSTKLALEILGKKTESFDDILRRLLADNVFFQKALHQAVELLKEGGSTQTE